MSIPLPSPAARPTSSAVRALARPSRAGGCGSHRDRRLGSPSFPSTARTLRYQLLQAAFQITHLAQITPVSAHLTVILLTLYFTETPNLSPYCTIFCHLRCKINKEEGRDCCAYRGETKPHSFSDSFQQPSVADGIILIQTLFSFILLFSIS